MPRPKPMTFQIRPPIRGLNTDVPPTEIDLKQTPSTVNTRFKQGKLQLRQGFRKKYTGADEPIIWIDTLYINGETIVVAFTPKWVYYLDAETDSLKPMLIWNGDTRSEFAYPFSMDLLVAYLSIDVGEGNFTFDGAGGASGGTDFEYPEGATIGDILVMVNGTDDGVFVFIYTGLEDSLAEGERLNADRGDDVDGTYAMSEAPAAGTSVAIFDNRIFIGGDENDPVRIHWSARGSFDTWGSTYGGGSMVLGDSPDWIQSMKRLGEYLIVYKERSIYIGQTTGLVDPPVRFEAAPGQGIGLAAPNSIGDLGEEHIFLGWDNVYVFSMRGMKPIADSVRDDMFYGEYGILPEYLNNCTGIIAEEFGEYWLFVPTGRWPSGTGGDTGTPRVSNVITNPAFNYDIADTGKLWTTTGTVTQDTDDNALFGLNTLEMASSATLTKSDIGDDSTETHSLVFWAFVDSGTANVTITISNDTPTTEYTTMFDVSETMSTRYVFSFDVTTNIDSLVVTVNSGTLKLDAMHLVSLEGVDDDFIYTEANGTLSVGFLNALDEPQAIPLIIDSVGAFMPDTVWVYNYEYNAWSVWRLPITGFGYDSINAVTAVSGITGTIKEQTWRFDEKRLVDLAPTNLIAEPDGQIYEMRKDVDVDWGDIFDTPILGFWESKDFDLDAPHMDKTLSRVLLYHDPTHPPVALIVSASTDGGLNWLDQTIVIASGRAYTIADFFVTGSQVRFRIQGETPGFFIDGFGVKIIPRGEAHAY